MNSISGKISPYDLLNILFPGVLAIAFCSWCFDFSISATDTVSLVVYFCVVYLAGILVSRVGSLIIEPLFKKASLVTWHESFYEAERKDAKISVLLKVMNMYRTLVSLTLFCCALVLVATFYAKTIQCRVCLQILLAFAVMIATFSASYIKQSRAIYTRVDSLSKKELL